MLAKLKVPGKAWPRECDKIEIKTGGRICLPYSVFDVVALP